MILVFHVDVALARYYIVIHMDILHHCLRFVLEEVICLAKCITFRMPRMALVDEPIDKPIVILPTITGLDQSPGVAIG